MAFCAFQTDTKEIMMSQYTDENNFFKYILRNEKSYNVSQIYYVKLKTFIKYENISIYFSFKERLIYSTLNDQSFKTINL